MGGYHPFVLESLLDELPVLQRYFQGGGCQFVVESLRSEVPVLQSYLQEDGMGGCHPFALESHWFVGSVVIALQSYF
jgi:hypothetical protein